MRGEKKIENVSSAANAAVFSRGFVNKMKSNTSKGHSGNTNGGFSRESETTSETFHQKETLPSVPDSPHRTPVESTSVPDSPHRTPAENDAGGPDSIRQLAAAVRQRAPEEKQDVVPEEKRNAPDVHAAEDIDRVTLRADREAPATEEEINREKLNAEKLNAEEDSEEDLMPDGDMDSAEIAEVDIMLDGAELREADIKCLDAERLDGVSPLSESALSSETLKV